METIRRQGYIIAEHVDDDGRWTVEVGSEEATVEICLRRKLVRGYARGRECVAILPRALFAAHEAAEGRAP